MRKELAADKDGPLGKWKTEPVLADGKKRAFEFIATNTEFPYEVKVHLSWSIENGRFYADEVTVRKLEGHGPYGLGLPVTSEVLHKVPLAALVREYLIRMVEPPQWKAPADELSEVANTYIGALMLGEPPAKAVAERFGWSKSVASKKIMAARAARLLSPTTRGKARGLSERPPPSPEEIERLARHGEQQLRYLAEQGSPQALEALEDLARLAELRKERQVRDGKSETAP